jgi:hypothetical protein
MSDASENDLRAIEELHQWDTEGSRADAWRTLRSIWKDGPSEGKPAD